MTRIGLRVCLALICLTTLGVYLSLANEQNWSDTTPQLSIRHIFEGEINRSGKATGFHYFAEGLKAARIKKVLSGPNKFGIYTAMVEIKNAQSGNWQTKFSSMFPDNYSQNEVINVILQATENSPQKNPGKWQGRSGRGYTIEGYRLKDQRIITAYPIYENTN